MGNAVPLITKRHDSLWLNHPKFVGSFVEGREVFFFFREVSEENCEKIYRSRIARVCTDDKGGRTILDSSWTTFLKARLDSSFRGEFPFRFNYLQDVVRTVRGGKVIYYAVFTTKEHEIPASAICRFGLDDIRDNIERGPFLRPTAPWGRIPDEDVPDNRPGDCSVDSTLLSYEDLNFVKSHPSLYEPVGSGDPLFTLVRQNYRLKTLTVTETGNRTVVFVGTDDGRVLKLVLSENQAVLLYVMRATEQPITNAGLNGKFLYVTSTDRLYEIPLLRHCRLLNDRTRKQDPHCSLMSTHSGVELEPRPSEHVQTVEKTNADVELEPRPSEHVPNVKATNADLELDPRRSEHLPNVQAKNASLDSPSTDHISLVAFAAIGWTLCIVKAIGIVWLIFKVTLLVR
ncbi:semaphorin-2A-like [Anneissia japonica]|uniref:semaphorin-2A-like n=1 Tax=Anneissia japonica TaxID=1529436 RepID=UPI0014257DBB|nr:semaphorin-2A-like [Anneissia japonica]